MSTAPDPYASAEAAEIRAEIQRALDALPFKQRSAVVLRIVIGMDYAEAAGAMDVPLNTYKSLLLRATRQLREILGPRLAEARATDRIAASREPSRSPAVPIEPPPTTHAGGNGMGPMRAPPASLAGPRRPLPSPPLPGRASQTVADATRPRWPCSRSRSSPTPTAQLVHATVSACATLAEMNAAERAKRAPSPAIAIEQAGEWPRPSLAFAAVATLAGVRRPDAVADRGDYDRAPAGILRASRSRGLASSGERNID